MKPVVMHSIKYRLRNKKGNIVRRKLSDDTL